MSFKLSQRSLDKLEGVDERLVETVKRAIEITTIDFGVIQGLRTLEEQKELVAKGASQTMKSRHLEGMAVDLMGYLSGRACWEITIYDDIADAMRLAAMETDTPIRWGGCWIVDDIREWKQPMSEAYNYYVDTRRKQGRRPFIDGPHFEIPG